MKKLSVILVLLILWGCQPVQSSIPQESTIGNPTAKAILEGNPDANILIYQDIVYSAGVSWVDELDLTKDKMVTEITEQSSDGKSFENGTANQLPVGTKIFSVKERGDILMAETASGDIRYYNLLEG